MNNKKIILVGALVGIILVIGATLLYFGIRHKKNNQVRIDSEYPIVYEKKDNNIVISLNGKETKKLKWEMEIEDTNIVSVTQKGWEIGGKAKYEIAPKSVGLTNVTFSRKTSIGSYQYDAAKISIPIYVTDTTTGPQVTFLENPKALIGPIPMAEDTAYPFLVYPYGTGQAQITFINGVSDWTINDPNGIISSYQKNGSGNESNLFITTVYKAEQVNSGVVSSASELDAQEKEAGKSKDPTTGIIQETTIEVNSPSLGITEYIDVHIDVNGNYQLTEGSSK